MNDEREEITESEYYAGEPCSNCGHGVLEHDDEMESIRRICRMGTLAEPCMCDQYETEQEEFAGKVIEKGEGYLYGLVKKPGETNEQFQARLDAYKCS